MGYFMSSDNNIIDNVIQIVFTNNEKKKTIYHLVHNKVQMKLYTQVKHRLINVTYFIQFLNFENKQVIKHHV